MIIIPALTVFLLGLGATTKYMYKLLKKKELKSIGAFVSTLYLTCVYFLMALQTMDVATNQIVRLGITILFLDRIMVFIYELAHEILQYKGVQLNKGLGKQ